MIDEIDLTDGKLRTIHLDANELTLLLGEALSGTKRPPYSEDVPDAKAAVAFLMQEDGDHSATRVLIRLANAAMLYFATQIKGAEIVGGVADLAPPGKIQ